MKRYYILEGDLTTVGGIVLKHTGAGSTTSWHGKVVSNVGDDINCPACSSVGKIKAVGVRQPFGNKGHTPAMNDDLCICKCSPPPKLIHSQEIFYQDVGGGSENIGAFVSGIASAVSSIQKNYNLKFQAKNSLGQPIVNATYMLVDEDGMAYFGETDAQGYTNDIFSDAEKNLSIHILIDDSEGFENG